jgi:hypothetical protein
MVEYPNDEEVPPRVLAAEKRREFRQKLEESSLFCQKCYHNLGVHLLIDISTPYRFDTVHGKCTKPGCTCIGPYIDEVHPIGVL